MRRDSSYLEIGVWRGHTLEAVISRRRVGVDPFLGVDAARLPRGVEFLNMGSDEFFANSREDFDAVLVDGLHEYRQAYRDIINAMNRLRPGGFVVIDDVLPPSECAAQSSWELAERCADERGILWPGPWTGDVFRAIWLLSAHHPEFEIRTIAGPSDGPAQSLAWWRGSRTAPAQMVGERELGAAEELTFTSEFRFGPPRWMAATTEKTAFGAFVSSRNALVAG